MPHDRTDAPPSETELGARAAELALGLSAAQLHRLHAYRVLIERWSRVYNLTSVRDPLGIQTQHLLDSLAALPALRRFTKSAPTRLLDVGSGAGLPGLALAIAAPELTVTCVDAVAKKTGFMQQVIAELQLENAEALHHRVETLSAANPWPLIASRAFSSLADFVRLTEHLLAPGGVWLAMKGRVPADEMVALPAHVDVFHVEPLSVPGLDAERCIVWMRKRSALA